jgi:hypothetical protein
MEEVVTYSLKNAESTSENYYQRVASFADEVLTEGEYLFELLSFGVLWRSYGRGASRLPARR